MKKSGLAALALVATLVSGCTSIGPVSIDYSRTGFNEAIQRTDAQQLLLNIVRQRYNDPVMFLEITAVSSSMSRSGNLNLSGFFPSGFGARESYTGGLGGSMTESPLVFYAPNTGEKFVRQILTPIDLKTISLLLQSGWSIERVLLVAADSINGLRNNVAGDNEYPVLAKHLRSLQRANRLAFAIERDANGADVLAMIPTPGAANEKAYQEACRILNIRPDGKPIRVQLGLGDPTNPSATVMLATRSLYSAFYFLGNGVQASSRDLAEGVAQNRNIDGTIFDPGKGDLFKVRSSRGAPERAAVKVRYRDEWFYIGESDQDTRTTFSLMSMLLMLQGGDVNRMTPLVSLTPR
jgi:hypothetical protein